jgi:hypothetical protein
MENFVPGAHKSLATKFCAVAPDIFIIITDFFSYTQGKRVI